MGIVINILYALLVAVIITVSVYVIVAKVSDVEMNVIHLSVLGCICLFTGIQAYLFFNAWDEKEYLSEQTDAINSILSVASGYIDSSSELKELKHEYKPVLNLLGIDVQDSGAQLSLSIDELNSYYNKYMWKRVGWTICPILIYIILCIFLIPKNNTSSHSYGDGSSLDTSDWQNY